MDENIKVFKRLILILIILLCKTMVHLRSDGEDLGLKTTEGFSETSEVNDLEPLTEEPEQPIREVCQCNTLTPCTNESVDNIGTETANRSDICKSISEECCNNFTATQEKEPELIQGETCGFRNPDGVIHFRILGPLQKEAQFGEFPWMITILEEKENDDVVVNLYVCGGSLIHPKVVLTAAHCVVHAKKKILKARGGEWNMKTIEESLPHQDRRVQQIIMHKEFRSSTGYNDIALLVLTESFAKLDNIDVICLPQHGDIILDKECIASGWGKDTFDKNGKYQVILKKVELPMVPRNVCEISLRHKRQDPSYSLHHSFVCAGGIQGADTCTGDGGSPLVCPIRNGEEMQYQQVGIVSWGIGCGTDIPGIYVNVANFVTWIDEQMNIFNLQPSYYYFKT